MLASPWTMNLCALLKAAMGDVDEGDRFATVLRERLKNRGKELLDQVGFECLHPAPHKSRIHCHYKDHSSCLPGRIAIGVFGDEKGGCVDSGQDCSPLTWYPTAKR